MDIIITQWGLDSYLHMVNNRVFQQDEYRETIRPNVLLLKDYPKPIEFKNNNFWSPARNYGSGGGNLTKGYKMKWHQVGDGNVQLRLTIAMEDNAVPCAAYVKRDLKAERRALAKFKTYLQLIQQGTFKQCGVLS